MKTIRWIMFSVMVALQISVPAYMILSREAVLNRGTAYKLRCGPMDPYDAFRGRYVALALSESFVDNWTGPNLKRGMPVYVSFAVGADGFAALAGASLTVPEDSTDYLEATVRYVDTRGKKLYVRLPFDRYYMEESQAPAAEAAYREQRRSETDVYIIVRVLSGGGVIEGLYIDDTSIESYLRDREPTGVSH